MWRQKGARLTGWQPNPALRCGAKTRAGQGPPPRRRRPQAGWWAAAPNPLLLETLRGRGLQVRRAQERAKQEPIRMEKPRGQLPSGPRRVCRPPTPGKGPRQSQAWTEREAGGGFWAPGREQEALPHLLSSLGGHIYLGSQLSLLELPSRCRKENFKQRTV